MARSRKGKLKSKGAQQDKARPRCLPTPDEITAQTARIRRDRLRRKRGAWKPTSVVALILLIVSVATARAQQSMTADTVLAELKQLGPTWVPHPVAWDRRMADFWPTELGRELMRVTGCMTIGTLAGDTSKLPALLKLAKQSRVPVIVYDIPYLRQWKAANRPIDFCRRLDLLYEGQVEWETAVAMLARTGAKPLAWLVDIESLQAGTPGDEPFRIAAFWAIEETIRQRFPEVEIHWYNAGVPRVVPRDFPVITFGPHLHKMHLWPAMQNHWQRTVGKAWWARVGLAPWITIRADAAIEDYRTAAKKFKYYDAVHVSFYPDFVRIGEREAWPQLLTYLEAAQREKVDTTETP